MGLLIITIYYNLSSNLKYSYLSLKNSYAKDNKYLAMITENGIWIKDEFKEKINIINAGKIENKKLYSVDILQFDRNFNLEKNIISEEILIKDKIWKIKKPLISNNLGQSENLDILLLETNINYKDINSLYSNLSSLNIIELNKLRDKYDSFPFYLMIMTVLATTIMIKIKYNKSKIFHLIFGILISVIIYYMSFFFEELGKNERLPVSISIWIPLVVIFLISTISLIKINEK